MQPPVGDRSTLGSMSLYFFGDWSKKKQKLANKGLGLGFEDKLFSDLAQQDWSPKKIQ